MHRLATEEQTPDGYWGELTDNGPTTGYNALTLCGVALYWEHSGDPAALEAIRRATDFHINFTWPDGTPVETINGRNRHVERQPLGPLRLFALSRRSGLCQVPHRILPRGETGRRNEGGVAQTLGRIAQNALYYHEGESASIPQERPAYSRQMNVQAGIRKTGPWVVCLSGLIDPPISNQFTLDRQGHLSIYHEKLGLIVTGANSKHQPELATFLEQAGDQTHHVPLSSRLRMSDDRDRLGLGYETFFAELDRSHARQNQAAVSVHRDRDQSEPPGAGDLDLAALLESGGSARNRQIQDRARRVAHRAGTGGNRRDDPSPRLDDEGRSIGPAEMAGLSLSIRTAMRPRPTCAMPSAPFPYRLESSGRRRRHCPGADKNWRLS